ncbi:chain-length determining protein [Halomonas denitrificans]|uniref:chain-length determining protein n=1 Tax=Halomonas denitrificans TaxID=370769 RepID=UPI001CD1D1E9|nr:chain-length determining protein [Halomonas denitrificans]MCA0974349.1 chain-length determining protein [Halomonas denitrificans]
MLRWFMGRPHWFMAFLSILVMSFYWLVWAEDRYVSEAVVVLESPQIAPQTFSLSSLLTGGNVDSDMLLLREYLLSVDMLKMADRQLDLRTHYSENGDLPARLWNKDAPIEDLHEYYLNRVRVALDDYAGVLKIEVQAFTPEFAQRLTSLLLEAGESHMNAIGQRLAEEQVRFLEVQVERLSQRLDQSREDLLDYQNTHGLVSPTSTVDSLNQVVASLEGELARMQARRSALASFSSQRSADMVRVESEITALRQQIDREQERLAKATGDSLNRLSSEYQRLELRARFAQETYSSALTALEGTRIEAARKLKQVSVLQSPLLPEYATRPDRLYNLSIFTIVVVFMAFIASMLWMIVQDHRD